MLRKCRSCAIEIRRDITRRDEIILELQRPQVLPSMSLDPQEQWKATRHHAGGPNPWRPGSHLNYLQVPKLNLSAQIGPTGSNLRDQKSASIPVSYFYLAL
jgi:hypothetical protein